MRPEIGRFITVDPVGPVDPRTSKTNEKVLLNPQKLNRYSYSLNNPYKYIDPDGQFPQLLVPLIVYGIIQLGELIYPQTLESPHKDSFIDRYSTDLLLLPLGIENVGEMFAAEGIKEGIYGVKGFTRHGLNRAIQRGVTPKSILDALKNPLRKGEVIYDRLGRPSQRLIGKEAEVVINPETGEIITVNPISKRKLGRLLRKSVSGE